MVFSHGQPKLTIGKANHQLAVSHILWRIGGGSLCKADPRVWWEPTLTPSFFARGPSQHPEVNAVVRRYAPASALRLARRRWRAGVGGQDLEPPHGFNDGNRSLRRKNSWKIRLEFVLD
jgi:hypothetical protein